MKGGEGRLVLSTLGYHSPIISPFLRAETGEDQVLEMELVENHVDGSLNMLAGGGSASRKPLKSGMKELAVFREKVTEQHRQLGKGGKNHLGLDEPKKLRPPPPRVRGSGLWGGLGSPAPLGCELPLPAPHQRGSQLLRGLTAALYPAPANCVILTPK